jgi:hypothetical protein
VDLDNGLENEFPRTPRGRAEVVGLVTGGVPGSVFSFATDLAGTAPPTREFDPPSFLDGSQTSMASAGVRTSTPAAAPARGAGEAAQGDDPSQHLTWVLFAVAAVAAIGAGVLVRSSRWRRDVARSGG